MLCDLCSTPDPKYRYPASDFIHAIGEDVGPFQLASRGDWFACQACHALIEAGDSKALAERCVAMIVGVHPEMLADMQDLVDETIIVHQEFFSSRKGEAVMV
jgi:hypothetical protein